MTLYINGRFKLAEVTGVQRYAAEILKRLPMQFEVITPDSTAKDIFGHLWEQTILSKSIPNGGTLWNPANTAPIFLRNQVVTIHDASVIDHPEWFNKNFVRFYKLMWNNVTKNSKYIITDSDYSAKRLSIFYPWARKKIISVPLGVDAIFFNSDAQKIEDIGKKYKIEGNYILSLGSLETRKNLKSLFVAWENWTDRPKNLSLVVAGGAGKNFSSMGFDRIPESVNLIGRVDDEDLSGLYSGAISFIFPSFYEGFGLPPLEAMAAGVPVICSNTTSLPEVCGGNCLYIDPEKPGTILDSLKLVVSDVQLRDELSKGGRERAKLFTWKRTAELTEQILRDAMN